MYRFDFTSLFVYMCMIFLIVMAVLAPFIGG